MTQLSDEAGIDRAMANAIHEHWVLFLVEGLVLLILGAAAIVLPPLATITVTILIGWLFLISGAVGLVTTLWMMRRAPGFWWSLLSAIVGIVAGLLLLIWPLTGAVSLTFVLTAFFIVEGVASIMYAVDHRNQLTGRWGWMLLSGIIDLCIAAIIVIGLPGTAAWALGLLVGVNLLCGGAALIGMALAARNPA